MFLLIASYAQQPTAVQPHVATHSIWVKQHMDDGTFLFAGPKKSGLGGVVLTRTMPKAALQELLTKDSYFQADVVDYQIIDFHCKLTAPELASLLAA